MNNKENLNNVSKEKKSKNLAKLLSASCSKYFSFKKSRLKSYYKSKKRFLEQYSDTKDFKDIKFNDLAPKDDIEKSEEYFNAIDWALHNEDIYNIALTGPYGSGKSSILKSFQKSYIKYKYLNISLAAFDVKPSGTSGEERDDSNKIEKGILQQLFYKVASSRIPYTRFRKIINTRFSSIIKIIAPIALNIILGLLIFIPSIINLMAERVQELSEYVEGKFIHNSIYLIYLVFIILAFYNIYVIIKHYKSRIKLSKLTFQKAQLELDKQDTESVFNKYLDEILYFFEATNYDVVMIEDLDRFNNSKIFTKLRELNLLINNYEKIKRKIVFIYAVKDDMFKEEERTKFFDFIIPVIPVINSVNSGEILNKLIYQDELGNGISKEFINGVSVYINDMRMLNNIYNEFRLYKSILNDISLKSEKILALVIYKNLCPDDFAVLQYKKGLVYEAFANKKEVLRTIENDINENIKSFEKNLFRKESSISISRIL